MPIASEPGGRGDGVAIPPFIRLPGRHGNPGSGAARATLSRPIEASVVSCRPTSVRRFALVTLAFAAVACGGAMAGAPTPSATTAVKSADSPDYATVDDAERALSRAERELAAVAPAESSDRREPAPKSAATPGGGAQPSPATPAPAAAPPPPPPPTQRSHADDARPNDEERAPRQPTPCETACRALASMGRAADAICRLAGDADARCSSARKRVEDSSSRVAACRCDAH